MLHCQVGFFALEVVDFGFKDLQIARSACGAAGFIFKLGHIQRFKSQQIIIAFLADRPIAHIKSQSHAGVQITIFVISGFGAIQTVTGGKTIIGKDVQGGFAVVHVFQPPAIDKRSVEKTFAFIGG